MNEKDLRKYCIDMFAKGSTIISIAKQTGFSRTYISNLIKEDNQYKIIKNKRKIKVYKRKNYKQMTIHIPTEFIKGIGISEDKAKDEFVNIFYDVTNNQIIIKKYREKKTLYIFDFVLHLLSECVIIHNY